MAEHVRPRQQALGPLLGMFRLRTPGTEASDGSLGVCVLAYDGGRSLAKALRWRPLADRPRTYGPANSEVPFGLLGPNLASLLRSPCRPF